MENFLNGNSKKEKEIINNNKDIVIIEKNWDLSNGGEKKKIDKTQMDIWNFEFLTIEDENPKITSSKYLDNLVVFKTKKNLDKIRQKQKKK